MNMGEHQTMDEWEGGEDDDEGDAAEDPACCLSGAHMRQGQRR